MDLLKNKIVKSPVKIGDKVFENILGTGINIVITRDM
ncbi:MAG: DUF1667 domain-containing protein [Fusobacteriaceae bacterium]|nr:DUF1667 domain-containing protein [Fusobacteriaceae bacterium]